MTSDIGVTPEFRPSDLAFRARDRFVDLQEHYCSALREADPGAKFREDQWTRPGGGGGRARILEGGALLEKAGINSSEVFGLLPDRIARTMSVASRKFYAAGISVVLHPLSPMIPTVHANYRYFEQDDGNAWFGGGSDLTPFYPFDEDIVHFHSTLRDACHAHDPAFYRKSKQWCDEYFFIKHRQETRGVGGIFFDYLKGDAQRNFRLVSDLADAFLPSYLPIMLRRKDEPYGEAERRWQLERRGRYVEFNLVYDRGTLFGLETQGRAESVLMSLPPLARWDYTTEVLPGSREAYLLQLLSHPRSWVDA